MEGEASALWPTFQPYSLANAMVNTVYGGIAGGLIGHYLFGESITGIKVGTVGYVAAAAGTTIYHWVGSTDDVESNYAKKPQPHVVDWVKVENIMNNNLEDGIKSILHASEPSIPISMRLQSVNQRRPLPNPWV